MKISFFRKVPQALYTLSSLAALAAVNYSIIHNPIVFIFILVLLVHELGHYFAAKQQKAKPSLPIFIPLPFIAIGITKIKNLNPKSKAKVSIAGPFAGALSAFLLLLLNLIYNYTSNFLLIFLLLSEIILNYIGSDGIKYRQYRRSYI
jgi:energy-converting hydrogenase Eha subunit A